MASNAQKTPLQRALNDITFRRTQNGIQRTGKTFPCSVTAVHGSIVTVKFEVLQAPYTMPPATMPVMGSEYIRYPIQVGCKGMAVSADAFLGAMSGLGTGTATLSEQPNLSALVFMPVGNVDFFSVDANALVLYGPDGAVLMDQGMNTVLTISNNGTATLQGTLHVTGGVIAGYGGGDQVGLQTHEHPQGVDGHDDIEEDTGAPVPGS